MKLFQKHVPLVFVLILGLVVVIETGLLIGGFMYYDTLSTLEEQTTNIIKVPSINK